jgi:serine/threonine protein kinase
LFKINFNQGQNSTTSEYYEQLFNDPHVNKLAFTDGGPEYPFKFDDFVDLETIATTRHIIKKMLHKKSGMVLAVKWVHIPHNRHSTDDENLKKLRHLVREVHVFRELRNEPNIVRFYGCCLYEHQALICMELMDLSLKVRIWAGQGMPKA